MSIKNLIIAVVLGVAMAAGLWTAMNLQRAAGQITAATVLPAPVALPAFSLRDQHGQAIDQTVFAGQWDLIFFGFTHCPDICPATLQILSAAKRQLEDAGHEELPRIVLVSVDPERDTPEVMAAYVSAFGDGNLGITGDLAELQKLTSALGIYFQKQATDAESYSVDHSAAVIVVDPDGAYRAVFGSPHVIANYVHDLPILMAGK